MVCEQFRLSNIATILVCVRQVWQGPPLRAPALPSNPPPPPRLPEILDSMLLSEASRPQSMCGVDSVADSVTFKDRRPEPGMRL